MKALPLLVMLLVGCSFDGPSGGVLDVDAPVADAGADAPPPDGPVGPCAAGGGDDDGDGICNNVDTWKCGATKPSLPGTVFNSTNSAATWAVDLVRFGGAQVSSVRAGDPIPFSFRWALYVECPDGNQCEAQLELGTPDELLACVANPDFDDQQMGGNLKLGTASGTLDLPARAEAYEIRLRIGVDLDTCPQSFTGGAPDPEPIAIICVR